MTATATAAAQPLWFIDNLARVHVDGAVSNGSFDLVEAEGRRGRHAAAARPPRR